MEHRLAIIRNGVVAITRDGRIAVMNDVAYRVLGLKPRPTDIGRPFVDVMKDTPDVTRIVEVIRAEMDWIEAH